MYYNFIVENKLYMRVGLLYPFYEAADLGTPRLKKSECKFSAGIYGDIHISHPAGNWETLTGI